MTFPTEQEIAFFREAKRIQEEWEPKPPDFFAYLDSHTKEWRWREVFRDTLFYTWERLPGHIFLPRPDQLWEILEERGYRWDVGKLPDSYTATIWKDDSIVECEGSTPSIALGKALIEVLGAE